jgi:cyclohexanone monooxygenase
MADCLAYVRDRGLEIIEPTAEAEDAWVSHANDVGKGTLYPRANSWYVGANIPGQPRIFMPYVGGVGNYRERCDEIAAKDYAGFRLGAGTRSASIDSAPRTRLTP